MNDVQTVSIPVVVDEPSGEAFLAEWLRHFVPSQSLLSWMSPRAFTIEGVVHPEGCASQSLLSWMSPRAMCNLRAEAWASTSLNPCCRG